MRREVVWVCLCLACCRSTGLGFCEELEEVQEDLTALTPSSLMQQMSEEMTKEERQMLLSLERAEVRLAQAKSQLEEGYNEWKQMIDLKERGIVTGDELNQSRRKYESALVEYKNADIELEQTLLGFLGDATYISVIEGQKYKTGADTYVARVVLKNTSNIRLARLVERALATHRRREAKQGVEALLTIDNIFVSIMWNGILIGIPYEINIPSLGFGEEKEVLFELQNPDAQNVVVQLRYLKRSDRRTIYLQKKSAEDIVTVRSRQFAQEGILGHEVLYDLQLDRLAENERTFDLELVNLPEQFLYRFEEQGKQVSKVKFAQGTPRLNLTLRVYVPKEMSDEELDEMISFFAVVTDAVSASKLRKLKKEREGALISDEELKAFKVGYEFLELTPRGVAEMELMSPNWYHEIHPGKIVYMRVTVKNIGTVRLVNIRIKTDLPYDWTSRLEPKVIGDIAPKEEATVDIWVTPVGGVEIGNYEMKVGAQVQHEGRLIEAQEKNVSIQVKPQPNVLASMATIGALVLLIGGIGGIVLRMSRR